MNNYLTYKNIYFLGIGGVGMSGLAGWLQLKKHNISGYDKQDSLFTKKLKSQGVKIQHNLSIKSIPNLFLDKNQTLVVYTPAIKENNILFKFFNNQNFTIIKRSDLLNEVSKSYDVIAIAGTHGKTTISIMLAHILNHAGYSPNAFFGGISNNFHANFLIGESKLMIIEADEYDRSFLKLSPKISIISSIDKDHVDTYKSHNDMMEAYFSFFIKTLNYKNINTSHGPVFMWKGVILKILEYVKSNPNRLHAHIYLKKWINAYLIKEVNFDINWNILHDCCDHNIKNAISALTIAQYVGVSNEDIINAIRCYKGVKRRFEYHINTNNHILIDDYAHHPVEIETLISSVRKLYPHKKIFFIFQPHLFSRTRDLEDDFCRVLSLVDQLALLNIYPAREDPIEGVSSKRLLDKINLEDKWLVDFTNVTQIVMDISPSLIITAGAGDVYKLIPDLKVILS
jgi:UDP-N-acetylmuramate--alanine ligase